MHHSSVFEQAVPTAWAFRNSRCSAVSTANGAPGLATLRSWCAASSRWTECAPTKIQSNAVLNFFRPGEQRRPGREKTTIKPIQTLCETGKKLSVNFFVDQNSITRL